MMASLGIHWIQLDIRSGTFAAIPLVEQPQSVVHCCVTGGFRHPRVSPPLPVAGAPVGGCVDQIFLHNVNVTFFLYAAREDLQHQPEPAVQGVEVTLDEDRGQSVTEQRLLHQGAQLVLLFGQQLETQVSGFPHPGKDNWIGYKTLLSNIAVYILIKMTKQEIY